MNVTDVLVCLENPVVCRYGPYYIVFLERDVGAAILLADHMKKVNGIILSGFEEVTEETFFQEWKLPQDPKTRIIEYHGSPHRYSKQRFGMMAEMIKAKGRPVPYVNLSDGGWGTGTDPANMIDIDVLHDGIYDLNKFHKEKGIPKFVRCDNGHAFLVSHFPSKDEFSPGKEENSPGQKMIFPGQ